MMNNFLAIGIDLGTSFSRLAISKSGAPEIVPNKETQRRTSSYVCFTDDERLFGESAELQLSQWPQNTVYDTKRLIGRRFSEIEHARKNWPFTVIDSNGRPKIQMKIKGEDKEFYGEQISGMILEKMNAMAKDHMGAESSDVISAVISVPALFNDSQRRATILAGRIAGLNVRLINEPTAAALAFARRHGIMDCRCILVFHLGGGTCDASIIRISDCTKFKVLTVAGDTYLGGADFDIRLLKHFAELFHRKTGKNVTLDPKALEKLRRGCVKVKELLSSTRLTSIKIESLHGDDNLEEQITREQFEDLCKDLFRRALDPIKIVMANSKCKIHDVLVIGGATRMPKIHDLLRELFDERLLNFTMRADETVAYGAAIAAAFWSNQAVTGSRNISLQEIAPFSIRAELGNGKNIKIFDHSTPIPSTLMFTAENSRSLKVLEERRKFSSGLDTSNEVNHFLGSFQVQRFHSDVDDHLPNKWVFSFDDNGVLSVEIVKHHPEDMLLITRDNFTLEQVEQLIGEAISLTSDDVKHQLRMDARLALEEHLYIIARCANELDNEKHSADKLEISQEVDSYFRWLDENKLAEKEKYANKLSDLRERFPEFQVNRAIEEETHAQSAEEVREKCGSSSKKLKELSSLEETLVLEYSRPFALPGQVELSHPSNELAVSGTATKIDWTIISPTVIAAGILGVIIGIASGILLVILFPGIVQ